MATKTSSRKKSTSRSKSVAVKSAPAEDSIKTSSTKTKHSKIAVAIIGGILLLLLVMFALKSFLIAATVNGQPISRITVIKELEKQGGQQTLEGLITRALIVQEAEKRNLTISEDEIAAEIKKIEESLKDQQTTLDEALSLQGMSREDLNRDIRLQLLVQKLVEEKVSLTDEEVEKYVQENDSFFPEDATQEKKLEDGREQLRQQKISVETQNLIDELRKSAKTIFFVNY